MDAPAASGKRKLWGVAKQQVKLLNNTVQAMERLKSLMQAAQDDGSDKLIVRFGVS